MELFVLLRTNPFTQTLRAEFSRIDQEGAFIDGAGSETKFSL